jgi:hypothetical protein
MKRLVETTDRIENSAGNAERVHGGHVACREDVEGIPGITERGEAALRDDNARHVGLTPRCHHDVGIDDREGGQCFWSLQVVRVEEDKMRARRLPRTAVASAAQSAIRLPQQTNARKSATHGCNVVNGSIVDDDDLPRRKCLQRTTA